MLIKRKCDGCRKNKKAHLSRLPAGSSKTGDAPPIVHNVLSSPGRPLEPQARVFTEQRFGYDLGHVRIHTYTKAAESAEAINARAYTVGSDIFFGKDQYQPGTTVGKKLLAHEVTHVIQQTASGTPNIALQRKENEGKSLESDCLKAQPTLELCFHGEYRMLFGEKDWDAVQRVQYALISTGEKMPKTTENGTPDGKYGEETERTVSAFKTKRGIYPNDGVVGPRTIDALDRMCKSKPCCQQIVSPPPEIQPPDEHPPQLPPPGGINTPWRVNAPMHPGWQPVQPSNYFIPQGEANELPHFLKVREVFRRNSDTKVKISEGRYENKFAFINTGALTPFSESSTPATTKFDKSNNQFWYGGTGPIEAVTSSSNPTPIGKHELQIPDFQHMRGSKRGPYGTTWFRIGDSGDRYLHAGDNSLGCTTITRISEWPKIWAYLITARRNSRSVGELEVL